MLARIAQHIAALAKLKTIWNGKNNDKNQNDACFCHIHFPICLRVLVFKSRPRKKNSSHGDEFPWWLSWLDRGALINVEASGG